MKKMLICACVTMAFLSGCMEVKTELFVRKNGSGTVTETVYMGPMLETMMQSMTQQFSAQMGSDSKGEEIQVPEETPIDEEKYKKKPAIWERVWFLYQPKRCQSLTALREKRLSILSMI